MVDKKQLTKSQSSDRNWDTVHSNWPARRRHDCCPVCPVTPGASTCLAPASYTTLPCEGKPNAPRRTCVAPAACQGTESAGTRDSREPQDSEALGLTVPPTRL